MALARSSPVTRHTRACSIGDGATTHGAAAACNSGLLMDCRCSSGGIADGVEQRLRGGGSVSGTRRCPAHLHVSRLVLRLGRCAGGARANVYTSQHCDDRCSSAGADESNVTTNAGDSGAGSQPYGQPLRARLPIRIAPSSQELQM